MQGQAYIFQVVLKWSKLDFDIANSETSSVSLRKSFELCTTLPKHHFSYIPTGINLITRLKLWLSQLP